MSGHGDILLVVALVLVAARLAGHASQRVGLPTPVGKIAVGLVVGPAVFGLVSDSVPLDALSRIGVVILMFIAGLETDVATIRSVSFPAFAVAIGGVALPFVGGIGVGYAFGLPVHETLFLAAILTATSVSISAQTLKELGLLQTREGSTVLAAAVIDDILGVAVLAFVVSLTGDGNPGEALGRMTLFLPVSFGAGLLLAGPVARRLESHLSTEAQLSLVVGAALVYAWAAEALGGVAEVTGAYIAGLLIARTPLQRSASEGLNWLGYGFFIPLFFVTIGLKADFGSLAQTPWLAAVLLATAILAKVLGCYAAARVARLTHRQASLVGVAMMSRGEVALVIAAAGLRSGSVSTSIFSASVLMALVTTLLAPLCLKLLHVDAISSASTPARRGDAGDYAALAEFANSPT